MAAKAVHDLLQQARQQQNADSLMKTVKFLQDRMGSGTSSGSGSGATGASQDVVVVAEKSASKAKEDEEWRVWTNHKNRKVGAQMREQDSRKARERTPFQLPGRPHAESRGYYSSTDRRNQATANSGSRATAITHLTEQQWLWFRAFRCLGCGGKHQA